MVYEMYAFFSVDLSVGLSEIGWIIIIFYILKSYISC